MKSYDWDELLIGHPIFSTLNPESRSRLLDDTVSQEFVYSPGSTVIAQGEVSQDIFLIGIGKASVCLKGTAGHQVPITHLKHGDFFGEIALIEHKARSATIVADEELTVLKIDGAEFLVELRKNAELEFKMLLVVSERLRALTEMYAGNVKELDEKFSLFGHQLDATVAKLEASQEVTDRQVEAKLRATDAIFQETKDTANNIWNGITRIGSILVSAVVVVIGIAAFFGIEKFNDIQEILDEVETIEERVVEAELEVLTIQKNIQGKAESIKKLLAEAEEHKELVVGLKEEALEVVDKIKRDRAIYLLSIVLSKDTFLNRVNQGEGNHLYKSVLETANSNVTEKLFKVLQDGIWRSGCGAKGHEGRQHLVALINMGIRRNYVKTPLQNALSYYYLLGALLLNGNEEEYEASLEEFSEYSAQSKRVSLVNYDPDWITLPFGQSRTKKSRKEERTCNPAEEEIVFRRFKTDVFCEIQDREEKNYQKWCT